MNNFKCKDCLHFNVCHSVEVCGSSFMEDATKCRNFLINTQHKDIYYSERLIKSVFSNKTVTEKLLNLTPGRCLHDLRIEAINDFMDLLETYYGDMYDVAGPGYDGRFVHEDEIRNARKEFIVKEYNKS